MNGYDEAHRGTKFFKYSDPMSLDEINEYFTNNQFLKIKGKTLEGETKSIQHQLIVTHYDSNERLSGRIIFRERKKESNSDTYYWKYRIFNFTLLREPSALILHGSTGTMYKIIKGFDNVVNPNDEPDDNENNPSFFDSYGYPQPLNKYIIKKIIKQIELIRNNILFDPHFKELGINNDVRGGEGFYRRDGTSATLDDKFCYLFELCTYWEPELRLRNCGGIISLTNTSPYIMTITADFAFKFNTKVRTEQLDQFWRTVIIPIIQEDDYDDEKTECVENARGYLEKIERIQ